MEHPPPVREPWFISQPLCFQSSFLLKPLQRQQATAQVFGGPANNMGVADGDLGSQLWFGPAYGHLEPADGRFLSLLSVPSIPNGPHGCGWLKPGAWSLCVSRQPDHKWRSRPSNQCSYRMPVYQGVTQPAAPQAAAWKISFSSAFQINNSFWEKCFFILKSNLF